MNIRLDCQILFLLLLGMLSFTGCQTKKESNVELQSHQQEYKDLLEKNMMASFSDKEMYRTVLDLQNCESRCWNHSGNQKAFQYLWDEFSAIPGVKVTQQDDLLKNLLVTLPGKNPQSNKLIILGAHYDCWSTVPNKAPGAMDNAAGISVLLQLAKIMSKQSYEHTIVFACWNYGEDSLLGSRSFVKELKKSDKELVLYLNFDAIAYDPENKFVLDLIFPSNNAIFKESIKSLNKKHKMGFMLVENEHSCESDHFSFIESGYPALSLHQETHGEYYRTDQDKIEIVSFPYVKKVGQLCLLFVNQLAGLEILIK